MPGFTSKTALARVLGAAISAVRTWRIARYFLGVRFAVDVVSVSVMVSPLSAVCCLLFAAFSSPVSGSTTMTLTARPAMSSFPLFVTVTAKVSSLPW